jgi:lipopolysaccharide/colanic/teichoic acid biosynthesis glycosyltransferase
MGADELSPSTASDRAEPRRPIEALLALVLLIGLAPFLATIAFAVYVESGTPIFFSQNRLGQRGRVFRLYKFRKFRADASDELPVTLSNDPRLTRVGRVLERWKLDEQPQLWNVLRGDMALVGPRPDTLDFADWFTGSNRQVLEYRPGIFGPNQFFFRNEAALYAEGSDPMDYYRTVLLPLKTRVDVAYFSSRTVLSDAVWIVRGILASVDVRPAAGDIRSTIAAIERWIGEGQHRSGSSSFFTRWS